MTISCNDKMKTKRTKKSRYLAWCMVFPFSFFFSSAVVVFHVMRVVFFCPLSFCNFLLYECLTCVLFRAHTPCQGLGLSGTSTQVCAIVYAFTFNQWTFACVHSRTVFSYTAKSQAEEEREKKKKV